MISTRFRDPSDVVCSRKAQYAVVDLGPEKVAWTRFLERFPFRVEFAVGGDDHGVGPSKLFQPGARTPACSRPPLLFGSLISIQNQSGWKRSLGFTS